MAHLSRAYVCIATKGREGRTPYVHADVLTEFGSRGASAKLIQVDKNGCLLLSVNNVQVHVTPLVNGWLCTRADGGGVLFQAVRTVEAPVCLKDVDGEEVSAVRLLTNWTQQWPKDGVDFEAYASELAQKQVHVHARQAHHYVSEVAVVDAVLATLGVPYA